MTPSTPADAEIWTSEVPTEAGVYWCRAVRDGAEHALTFHSPPGESANWLYGPRIPSASELHSLREQSQELERMRVENERLKSLFENPDKAERYLAGRADDTEPLTEKWWSRVTGCNSELMVSFSPYLGLFLCRIDGMIRLARLGPINRYERVLANIKTRGDVRKFCESLGITLKDGGPDHE